MKKTLLAAAIAACSATAVQAQSSVTLYGIVGSGFGQVQYKDRVTGTKATRTGFDDGTISGNRFGIRGVEDLGDGLRAEFKLESAHNSTTGEILRARLFGREATIALAHDNWGKVAFGLQTNFASRWAGTQVLPWGNGMKEGRVGLTFSSANTLYTDNMITYESPVMSGFQFGVGYSFNVNGNQAYDITGVDDPNVKLVTLGLRYTNGPLAVVATYDTASTDAKIVSANPLLNGREVLERSVRGWNLAGSYDFDVVKLRLGFGQDRNGIFNAAGRPNPAFGALSLLGYRNFRDPATGDLLSYKTNNYGVSLDAPVGSASRLMAAWSSTRLASGGYKTVVAEKNSQNIFSVAYYYDLSKRTRFYGIATRLTGFAFYDVTATQAIVGLHHTF